MSSHSLARNAKVSLTMILKLFSFCISVLINVFIGISRNKSILQPSELMGMCQSPASWKGWVFDLAVKRPVSWTFGKIKGMVYSPSITSQTQFVHLASIKVKYLKILSNLQTFKIKF